MCGIIGVGVVNAESNAAPMHQYTCVRGMVEISPLSAELEKKNQHWLLILWEHKKTNMQMEKHKIGREVLTRVK